jgi:two-component system, NtrC family, response regulator AtoC
MYLVDCVLAVGRGIGSQHPIQSMSEIEQIGRERPLEGNGSRAEEQLIFGFSEAMEAVRKRVEKVANTCIPLLIQGEGGTGKELLARWIHAHSCYRSGEFVKVNCAAIPNQLLESELFGYEKGAFTGAYGSKPGRVELANNGILFLDEIADLDPISQAKLLQFLQDGTFCRIGDSVERVIQTRVICATGTDLEERIKEGGFRADLFYRINVVRLCLPRLRERREDIAILTEHLRQRFVKEFKIPREPLSRARLAYLERLQWPGNIRELSNFVLRYVLTGMEGTGAEEDGYVRATALNNEITLKSIASLRQRTKAATLEKERSLLLEALRANQWNRRKAAASLRISYRTLIYKIKNAGIPSRRTPPSS